MTRAAREIDEIEITPAMLLAGVRAYFRWDRSEEDPECMVAEVFHDMLVASGNSKFIFND